MFNSNESTASYISGFLTGCGQMGCIESEYRRAGLWNWDSHAWNNEQELADSFLQQLFPSEKPQAILRNVATEDLESHLAELIRDWISVVADRTDNASTRIFEDAEYREILTRKYVDLISKVCKPTSAFSFDVKNIENPDVRRDDFVAMISSEGKGWIFFLEATC